MPKSFKEISTRLADLSASDPNRDSRSEVTNYLTSKHEGLKLSACKALSKWGDSDSIANLKSELESMVGDRTRWKAVSEISKLLRPHLSKNDIEWFLTLYSRCLSKNNRTSLTYLVHGLPNVELVGKLESFESSEKVSSEAAKELRSQF